jgi:hypothetical protein
MLRVLQRAYPKQPASDDKKEVIMSIGLALHSESVPAPTRKATRIMNLEYDCKFLTVKSSKANCTALKRAYCGDGGKKCAFKQVYESGVSQ